MKDPKEANVLFELKRDAGMRKLSVVFLALTLVLGIAIYVYAGQTAPGIKNTPHDVYNINGNNDIEPCAMCHTPHSGSGDYPLWNRAAAGVAYDMYRKSFL